MLLILASDLMAQTKEQHRISSHKHYEKNKKYYRDRNKRRYQDTRQLIRSLKKQCAWCGYSKHSAALDFHHKDGEKKEATISLIYLKGWGRERILKEVDKCVIICSNCHREHHALEREKGNRLIGRT